MKTAHDPRHIKRVKIMQDLFSWNFHKQNPPDLPETKEVIKNLIPIDEAIKVAAPAWPIEKINRIDLSILRLCTYELLISKDAPVKVIVDEGVEMAKEYGSGSSASFVNGALGKLITDLHLS